MRTLLAATLFTLLAITAFASPSLTESILCVSGNSFPKILIHGAGPFSNGSVASVSVFTDSASQETQFIPLAVTEYPKDQTQVCPGWCATQTISFAMTLKSDIQVTVHLNADDIRALGGMQLASQNFSVQCRVQSGYGN